MIKIAREVAMSYLGTPYSWGGDDPMKGFDCSGFCIEILKSVGLLPRSGDWTANSLYSMFPPITRGQLGTLVYWKSTTSDRIIHVEFCLGQELSIGASGGGSKTTSIEKAIAQNAFIKIRPYHTRKNLAGFNDPFAEMR